MTRSEFELIAHTIREFVPPTLPMPESVLATYRQELAEKFADSLAPTNPRFDRDRFIRTSTGGN